MKHFRLIVFLLFAAIPVKAQTAVFPGAAATDAQLKVQVNGIQTTLTASLTPSALSASVASCTGIVANTLATIDKEIMAVSGCSGGTLSMTSRGFDGTAAAAHASFAPVSLFVDAWHHNALRVEVEAIENAYSSTSVPTLAGVVIPPTLYNPNPAQPSEVCLDTLGGNIVTQPIGTFGATSTVLWSGTSPVMPPNWAASTLYPVQFEISDPAHHLQITTGTGLSGSSIPSFNDSGGTTTDGAVTWQDHGLSGCTTPLPIEDDYGFNSNSYAFFRAGFATDDKVYNAITDYGGITANNYLAGVLYPTGTITTTGALSFPTYLGGHVDVGHSAGPPASAKTTGAVTGGVSTTLLVNNAGGLAPGVQIVFEDSSPESVTVAGSYTVGSLTVPLNAAPASNHSSGTFVGWCCGNITSTIAYITNPFSWGESLVQGMMYWDDTLSCLRVYSGTAWACLGSGGGTPAGSNSQVQFNNSGSFGASANLTFSGTALTVGGSVGTGAVAYTFNSAATGANPAFQINSTGYEWTGAGDLGVRSLSVNSIYGITLGGALTVSSCSGCGTAGSPAGANTQLQYNNSGSFGASANLTFAGGSLTVGGGVGTGAVAYTFNSPATGVNPAFQISGSGYEWTGAGDLGVHSLSVNSTAATISAAGGITANGGLATGASSTSTIYIGAGGGGGNFYGRTTGGAASAVTCGAVADGWQAITTDDYFVMCLGGARFRALLASY